MSMQQEIETPVHVHAGEGSVRAMATPRNGLFASLVAVSAFAFLTPLRSLLNLCLNRPEYSYIALIPMMLLGLFYVERERIFRQVQYSFGFGAVLILAGAALAGSGTALSKLSPDSRLFLQILGLVVVWIGSFALCYGKSAARAGTFALLFGLLLVPLPQSVMAQPILFIQHGSANVTGALFRLSAMPVFRDGLTFSLPGLNFVVATECSGIHSTVALFVASILAGHFYFKPGWKSALLVVLVLPVICFTNGLRMFVLAALAVYVNPAFFHGNLHHKGGSLFFALALAILAGVIKLLGGRMRLQRKGRRRALEPARV